MQRALLLILSFSILAILHLLSVHLLSVSVYGQNTTNDDYTSAENPFNLINLFIGTILLVAGASIGVPLWINSQGNHLRKDLENHTDKKNKELKDDLIKQIDKVEDRLTFIERNAMLKSLRDADKLIRELKEEHKK